MEETGLDLMIRSIEEPDPYGVLKPIWPEKYPADLVEKMRESTDQIEWALWYMNKPVPAGYSALQLERLSRVRTEIRQRRSNAPLRRQRT